MTSRLPPFAGRSASPAPQDLDEAALRARAVAGDRAAAGLLFERHVDALYEFVWYRVGRDTDAAESVVQDTLLAAFRNLATFEGRSALHTWLCGIAKNHMRSLRRKRRPIPLEDLLADADPEIELALLALESEEVPEAVLERRETRELVGAALSSLPPDYRRALIGKYVDERSVAELAAEDGRGSKAMESLLSRARAAFVRVVEILARKRGGL